MFEQSLVISRDVRVSAGARWTWAGSVALQVCAAALLVVVPLLHPERMALTGVAPRLFVPVPPVKLQEVKLKRVAAAASTAQLAGAVAAGPQAMTAPARIPHGIASGDAPSVSLTGSFAGLRGTGLPEEIATGAAGPRVGVATSAPPAARTPMRLSSGVGVGLLLTPIRPVYPPIARAARVEGSVVVEAVISREGKIERTRVLRGPAMLAAAALEAIRQARYQPYRLNGEPTEVETTITVNFKLGG